MIKEYEKIEELWEVSDNLYAVNCHLCLQPVCSL